MTNREGRLQAEAAKRLSDPESFYREKVGENTPFGVFFIPNDRKWYPVRLPSAWAFAEIATGEARVLSPDQLVQILTPEPGCEGCGDDGFIEDGAGNYGRKPCPTCHGTADQWHEVRALVEGRGT